MIPIGHLLLQYCEVGSSHPDLSAGMFWGNMKCFSLPWALGKLSAPRGWISAGFRVFFLFFIFCEEKALSLYIFCFLFSVIF